MHGGLLPKGPGRAHEPAVPLVDLGMLRQRVAWMQIERHVQLFYRLPERPVLLLVVVSDGVCIAYLRKSVGQRANHAEILYAALQLSGSESGILEWESGQASKASGLFTDCVGEVVVGLARDVVGLPRIGDRLDGGGIEREDHHLDAELIHQANAPPMQIENAVTHFQPDV